MFPRLNYYNETSCHGVYRQNIKKFPVRLATHTLASLTGNFVLSCAIYKYRFGGTYGIQNFWKPNVGDTLNERLDDFFLCQTNI